jgi:O-antigen/teichoic acid export membrane protein
LNEALASARRVHLSVGNFADRVISSKMARQAVWLFGLNSAARGMAFIGSAYAARCLGPANLGISALVASISQLVVVLANGGLDTVAVRRIAANPGCARGITASIVWFRTRLLAAILPLGLCAVLILTSGEHAFAWCVGAILPIGTSFGLSFVFQGLEKLPLQALVSVLTSAVTAAAFFFFRPGMPAGSDVAVMAFAGFCGMLLSFWLFRALASQGGTDEPAPAIAALLRESRPYWMLAVVVYCYSTLQVPLVGYIAGKQSLGAYRSALMLVAGLDLLYSSINSLLLPRLVAWRRKGPTFLWHRQKELLFLFLFSGGAISAGVISLAPVVYRRFLGVAFTEAILPFQILVVGRLAVFVGQIFAWSLSALHLDRQFFLASLAGAVFSVGANLLFVPCYGIVAAAVVSVLSEIVVHGLCFISVKRYISRAIAISATNPI